MAELTLEQTVRQAQIERGLGMTKEEALFINANGETPVVKRFIELLYLQATRTEPIGIALLENSLKEVRMMFKEFSDKEAAVKKARDEAEKCDHVYGFSIKKSASSYLYLHRTKEPNGSKDKITFFQFCPVCGEDLSKDKVITDWKRELKVPLNEWFNG